MSKGRIFKHVLGWIGSCLFFESFIAIGIICALPHIAMAAFPSFDFDRDSDDERCTDTRMDLEFTLPDGISEPGNNWVRDKRHNASRISKNRHILDNVL